MVLEQILAKSQKGGLSTTRKDLGIGCSFTKN